MQSAVPLIEIACFNAVGFNDVVLLENIQCSQCGTAGERVACVGMGMQEAAFGFIVIKA